MATNAQEVSFVVLYIVQFDRDLNDEVVARVARILLENPLYNLTPQEEYTALAEAMGLSVQLSELLPSAPAHHSEQEFRDFFRRLLERLDAMRPW